jgi:hypothetical protein
MKASFPRAFKPAFAVRAILAPLPKSPHEPDSENIIARSKFWTGYSFPRVQTFRLKATPKLRMPAVRKSLPQQMFFHFFVAHCFIDRH